MSRLAEVFQGIHMNSGLLGRKLTRITIYVGIVIVSILLAIVVGKTNAKVGFGLLAALLGAPFAIAGILNPKIGLLTTLGYSYFIIFIKRVTGLYDTPLGTLLEGLLFLTLIGTLVKIISRRDFNTNFFKSPLFISFMISIGYMILEVFNPTVSSIAGWAFSLRGTFLYFTIFICAFYCFSDDDAFVKLFSFFWLGLALLAAFYGLYQEFVGMPEFDLKWVYSSPVRFKLNFIWGRFRKWSFLSDSMTFGVFMAFAGIYSLVRAMGPYSMRRKITFGIITLLTFWSMAYSGTRTAYAIVPIGVCLYVLTTIDNGRTLLFAIGALSIFIFLIFGPIRNPVLDRVRSAFEPGEDASMQVRDENRARIQPYIYSHPIGGGLMTSGEGGMRYYPNHPLAGYPPDSGYLKIALEMGWIGLILKLVLNVAAILVGVSACYKLRDPKLKNICLAYVCAVFAVSIADLAQIATTKHPIGLIIYCSYAIFIYFLEKAKKQEQEQESISN
ncbi:O-antigen ligase family protein [Fulvivirga ligni]|uniref:O-antigen ligase family protein n=1 Tax=Fulvivirga ligni TaxID=2904246 RepID=UPI001F3DE80E|nr:O-antigen ligase family protein [Fulvivirga ligni]UII19722.1 O-antigen ligase family protein [Fulvivirga ligni]